MTYTLIYINLLGQREVLTEHATDDDIEIFVNNSDDITVISEDTDRRVEIEMESGIVYIYEPVNSAPSHLTDYKYDPFMNRGKY